MSLYFCIILYVQPSTAGWCPEVKKKLWGGEFWSDGYFVSTVGLHGNEDSIKKYIQNQDSQRYTQLHREQLRLF